MSMRTLEAAILRELREVTGNKKLRQKDIQEWLTGIAGSTSMKAEAGEALVFLPKLSIYVAYTKENA